MARPRSNDKRSALLSAATRVIATEGLGASTAAIAKEACVSHGSLFIYFSTKADLLNQLYVQLKEEAGRVALEGLPAQSTSREQLLHIWSRSLRWATCYPEKRRTLAHLSVSDEITVQSRESGHRALVGIAKLLERIRADGSMRDVSLAFIVALFSAHADTTIDFMIRDTTNADSHCHAAFNALWRMLT
jgi:AcrR family transcriptional regulator